MSADPRPRSCEGEEQLLQLLRALRADPVGVRHALTQCVGDDEESGAVQRLLDRGQLLDHVAAVGVVVDRGDDGRELPLCAAQPVQHLPLRLRVRERGLVRQFCRS